jgi:hypothetical protein
VAARAPLGQRACAEEKPTKSEVTPVHRREDNNDRTNPAHARASPTDRPGKPAMTSSLGGGVVPRAAR